MLESQEIHFPEDVWFHILPFLHVKTLLRFRAVCKYLLSLIDDPYLVSLHLRSFPPNRHETHYYLLTLPNKNDTYECIKWEVCGSMDGLLLLSKISSYNNKEKRRLELILWNPSTRKERQLPLPHSRFHPANLHALALGYDQLRQDYKVLLLRGRDFFIGPHLDHALYSDNKGSWKTLDSNACGFGFDLTKYVSFSGGVVWIESSPCRRRRHLAMFDFVAETARHALLPYATFFIGKVFRVDDGSLGVLTADEHVWVLDTETMEWTSRYKITTSMNMWSLDRLWTLVRSEENDGELVLLERFTGEMIKLLVESGYGYNRVRTKNASTTVAGIYVESLVRF